MEKIFSPDDRPTPAVAINGGVLAVAGVVICPITSGDTAFRSARTWRSYSNKCGRQVMSEEISGSSL